MGFLPNISPMFGFLNLKDKIESILENNLASLKALHRSLKENIVLPEMAERMMMSSLKLYTQREITPEMVEYLSRMALRSLASLPPIQISTKNRDAIKKLEGSISWITEKEIDVTEFIREMREGE